MKGGGCRKVLEVIVLSVRVCILFIVFFKR